MKNWFKRLRLWSLQWANTRWGSWALFLCAFADASFLGLPTPMLFFALALLNIKKAYKYALLGILGTLAGSIAGYSIGHFAWLDTNGEFTGLAQFMFNNIPGFSETGYDKVHILYGDWDFWILFIAASLPLPYKLFSISSGVFDINFFIFCFATLISQGIKFFLLAFLTIKFGPEVKKLLEFNWKPIAIIATVCITITIVIIKVF
ncbi:MAG: DedA family protein [Bacteroidia bacterium]|nr:DedA family protein [Bacteroidia bacterium]